MQELIMLVGLPGSGKSTFAKHIVENGKNYATISTDRMRLCMYGDEAIQGDGDKVFKRCYEAIDFNLTAGHSVIFDATNVKRKFRKAFIERFKNWKNKGVKFMAVVVATPYEKCLENNLNRRRVVPEEVIKRMMCNFEVPMNFEGWDEVRVYRPFGDWAPDGYNDYLTFLSGKNRIPHDCEPWHTGLIFDHINAVCDEVVKDCYYLSGKEFDFYGKVATWHDLGKAYVKTYSEKKKRCIYYNHNNVSAYLYCASSCPNLDIAFVIEKHMEAHHYDTDQECYDALIKQGIDKVLVLKIIRFGKYDNAGALAVEGTVLR